MGWGMEGCSSVRCVFDCDIGVRSRSRKRLKLLCLESKEGKIYMAALVSLDGVRCHVVTANTTSCKEQHYSSLLGVKTVMG